MKRNVLNLILFVLIGLVVFCSRVNYQEVFIIINIKKLDIEFEYYELGGLEIDIIGYIIFDIYVFVDQDYLLVFNIRNW